MSTTDPRLIDKAAASKKYGIPVPTLDHWVRVKALPFVQPVPQGKVYFSTRVLDHLIERAEGQYVVEEPDFSEPVEGSERDPFTDLTVMEPGHGAVHQSRRAEYDRYVAARAEGKSVAEAIAAAEGLAE